MSYTYTWKILELSAENDVIIHAKYHVTLKNEDKSVETEGNWYFTNPQNIVALNEVTEQMVCDWIEKEAVKDGISLIKFRLEEQANLLKKSNSIVLPWQPQVFTPNT